MIIGENEGISIIELSKIQIIEKSTAGKTIQKLEKKGLVIRKQNLNDKREFNLFLTTKGEKILPKLYRTYDEILNNIFADIITVEKKQYFQITKKINEILSK